MLKLLRKTSTGMTLLELSAGIVVMSIIGIGMTSGAQAVMLHYQSDTVRQDLRQYGNNIMREIVRELNLAQKIEFDSFNGFQDCVYINIILMYHQSLLSHVMTELEYSLMEVFQ